MLAGAAFLVAGLLAYWRRSRRRLGALMMAAGALGVGGLLVADVGTALIAVLLLAFPAGRLPGRISPVVATTIVVTAIGLGLTHDAAVLTAAAVAEGIAVLGLLLARFARATPPVRRRLGPALLAALLLAVALAGEQGWIGPVAPAADAVYVGVAACLLFGLLRTRLTGTRMRQLVVGLDRLPDSGPLERVLGRALGDPSLRVGYWIPRQGRFVGSDGQPVELPVGSARATATVLGNEDEPLAVLVHDPALLDDAGLVDAVAAAARLALENERLQAQIRLRVEDVIASRARIVAASDAERRRIERDLHDGAQQQLVSLALTLKLLELELGDQAVASTAPLIREAESEVLDAIDELRSLAHGIFPPVLGEEGLAAALEELADESPVAVTIADLPEGRLPAPVEAAAYFACRAAIASAVGARQLRIAATTTGDRLRLEIGDDGPDRRRPVESLEAVRDRVEALGGRLVVGGAGSSLVAEIPVGGTPLLPSRSPVPIA